MFNIADLFELTASGVADRTALVAGPTRLTYAELDERANRFGHVLVEHGIGPGDHVAILARNRAEWLEAMLGTFKVRAVPINVNYRYTRNEVLHVLDDSRAAALVVEHALAADLGDLRASLPTLRVVIALDGNEALGAAVDYEVAITAAASDRSFEPRSGDDRYVLYTGGTTGMPKGVVWRSEDLFFAALRGGNLLGDPISEPDQILDVLAPGWEPWLVTSPLMHGNGQWNTLLPLLTGRGVVLWTGHRFDGAAIARLAAAERAQLLVLVGDAMAIPFLDAVETDDAIDLSSIAVIASGGAMLSPITKDRLAARLPGAFIVDGFGASETGSSGTMVGSSPGELPRFTVGSDVAVLDDDLRPVPVGHVGRLARSGHLPLGYWNDPEKTAATFPTDPSGVRWAIPGDLARLNDDGTLTLLGRGSSSINTGGEKVHPDEVANALKSHPQINDALVIGVRDERFGQMVVALVASTSPIPGDDSIRDHLRPLVASYKIPRRVIAVDQIRYTPQGKPDLAWADAAAAMRTER